MYRLYIEDFDRKNIWAIDEGTSDTVQHFEQVIVDTFGITKYNPSADNKKEPKVWLEFPAGRLKIIGDTALIR